MTELFFPYIIFYFHLSLKKSGQSASSQSSRASLIGATRQRRQEPGPAFLTPWKRI
jgi:hypothetical protein